MTLASGCRDKGSAAASSGSAAATTAATANAARAPIELTIGEARHSLAPSAEGYAIDGGSGRVKIQSDRVKVKLQTDAKVEQKDYGFKVYGPSDDVVLKGKRHGAGWKLKGADDAEIGKLDAKGGTLAGAAVEVRREGEQWVVTRSGATVGRASGSLSAPSAALLAVTEVTPEQRIAMVIFSEEIAK
jgi:hypothetical protein